MRYVAVAVDFDGTLARDGRVDEATAAAIEHARGSGRRVILVTGRELPDLFACCPRPALFDAIVAENGGVLYLPATGEERPLAPAPPATFVEALRARQVEPLNVGRVVVATWASHRAAVLDAIHTLGLEHQVIFNKGAMMILPPMVNKATGLRAALRELRLSPRNVVAIGDAENDHAMFGLAECAVAVANALPSVKADADLVTRGEAGAGVTEVIEALAGDDLAALTPALRRHDLVLGQTADGRLVMLPAHNSRVLIAGASGSGKSTVVAGILERLTGAGYQYCLLDPEGDHETLPDAVVVGEASHPPAVSDVLRPLAQPDQAVIVNLLGVSLMERPAFFASLQDRLDEFRGATGRPHWLALDEAHHLAPLWGVADAALPARLTELMLVTVDPAHLAPGALARINVVIVTGRDARATIAAFCRAIGETPPPGEPVDLDAGEALIWMRETATLVRVRVAPTRSVCRRHRRKYAQGEIDPAHGFAFRAPAGEIAPRAGNLQEFDAIAGQLDDETWLYHLRRGDFARWFRDVVKDEELAVEADRAAVLANAAATESRAIVRRAINRCYTLPA